MSIKIDNVKDVMTSNQPRKRAAIYVRVSTEDQAKKFGPTYQQDEILAWAKYNPHPSYPYDIQKQHVYLDEGYSGASDLQDRPALTALFEAAARKEFDVVLVWKVDRFFRKLEWLLRYIRELSELDVGFVSVTQPELNTTGTTGKLLLSILGALAEIERDNILERTKSGKQAAARAGKWVGGQFASYGYDLDEERKMSVNEKEAAVVRQIFEWFVHEKRSTYDIQQKLHALKIITKADTAKDLRKKDGKPMKSCRRKNPAGFWSLPTIVNLLKQDAYTGQYFYNKRRYQKDPKTGKMHAPFHDREDWIALPCPQIVDQVLWQKAQDRLAHNKRFATKNRIYEYLFSGKIACCVCHSPYAGYMQKKSRKKKVIALYGQYRCRKSNKSRVAEQCRNIQISERELESRIWPHIRDFLSDPNRYLRDLQKREQKQEGTIELRSKQKEIADRLLTLQHERERVCYLYEKGIGYQRKDDVEKRFQEIEEEQRQLKTEEQALCARVLTREQERDRLQSAAVLSQRFRTSLDNADLALKKQIIQLLVHRIVVSKDRIRVELKIEKPQPQEADAMVAVKNEIQRRWYGDPDWN